MTAKATSQSTFNTILEEYGYYMVLIVSLVATLGSLYFSEIRHFDPCRLCWFQRIFMYPIGLLTIVGIIKQDEYLPNYVLPLSLIGICFSVYHVLLQNQIISQAGGCTGVSCSLKYINYFGFVSIPVLAGTAFLIINIIMIAMWRMQRD